MRLIRRFDHRLEDPDPSLWTPKLANWMRMIGSIPASPHCQDRQFFTAGHGATFLPRHSMRGLFEANKEKKANAQPKATHKKVRYCPSGRYFALLPRCCSKSGTFWWI